MGRHTRRTCDDPRRARAPTRYTFDRPVGIGPHTVRLRPAPHCRTPITGYSLRVEPATHFVNWQQDAHGNHVARLVFPEPATGLTITVDLVAELMVINPFGFFVEEYAERYGFAYPDDLYPFVLSRPCWTSSASSTAWSPGRPGSAASDERRLASRRRGNASFAGPGALRSDRRVCEGSAEPDAGGGAGPSRGPRLVHSTRPTPPQQLSDTLAAAKSMTVDVVIVAPGLTF
jgi:hypothetical protein